MLRVISAAARRRHGSRIDTVGASQNSAAPAEAGIGGPQDRAADDQPGTAPTGTAPTPGHAMAAWVPAARVGGVRHLVTGARVFAGLVALLVLTRRRAA